LRLIAWLEEEDRKQNPLVEVFQSYSALPLSGVSAGVSSAHLLSGLYKNRGGHLHSMDLPVIHRSEKREKGQSSWTIPHNLKSGWAVPEFLIKNWDLVLGSSEQLLPKLLRRIDAVDFFVHDSPHSAEHLAFELKKIKRKLHSGSLVVADNTGWPSKPFEKFASSVGARVYYRRQSSLAALRIPA